MITQYNIGIRFNFRKGDLVDYTEQISRLLSSGSGENYFVLM